MRFLITGYYGAGNIGDELILSALLRLLRRIDPAANVTVLSFSPEETAQTHQVHSLYRAPFVLRGTHRFGLLQMPWPAIARAIRAADLVLVGGGGLWEDIHNFGSIPQYLQTIAMAIACGRPAVGVGLGVGPLMTGLSSRLIRLIANHMALIVVRDQWSANELARCGVAQERIQVGADLVFTLTAPSSIQLAAARAQPVIGVTLGPAEWLDVKLDELATAIDQASRRVQAQNVIVFPMCTDKADRRIAQALSARITVPHQLDLRQRRPEELLDFVAGLDVILSAKLHGVIAGACMGVPTVCLSYAPKVSAAAQRLGIAAHAVDKIDTLTLAAEVERAWVDRSRLEQCNRQVAALGATAEHTFNIAVARGLVYTQPRSPAILDALQFAALAPAAIMRQALRSYRGNRRWAAGRSLPALQVANEPIPDH